MIIGIMMKIIIISYNLGMKLMMFMKKVNLKTLLYHLYIKLGI